MLTGGCYCGAVRYQAEGEPFERAVCWCEMCRRTSGAPGLAWFSVFEGDFRWTAGTPVRFASSPGAEREFCGACGTQLTFRRHDEAGRVDLTTGSLDDPEGAPPVEQIWLRSRPTWAGRMVELPGQPTDDAHS